MDSKLFWLVIVAVICVTIGEEMKLKFIYLLGKSMEKFIRYENAKVFILNDPKVQNRSDVLFFNYNNEDEVKLESMHIFWKDGVDNSSIEFNNSSVTSADLVKYARRFRPIYLWVLPADCDDIFVTINFSTRSQTSQLNCSSVFTAFSDEDIHPLKSDDTWIIKHLNGTNHILQWVKTLFSEISLDNVTAVPDY